MSFCDQFRGALCAAKLVQSRFRVPAPICQLKTSRGELNSQLPPLPPSPPLLRKLSCPTNCLRLFVVSPTSNGGGPFFEKCTGKVALHLLSYKVTGAGWWCCLLARPILYLSSSLFPKKVSELPAKDGQTDVQFAYFKLWTPRWFVFCPYCSRRQ